MTTEFSLVAGFDEWFTKNQVELQQVWNETSDVLEYFEGLEDFALEIYIEQALIC